LQILILLFNNHSLRIKLLLLRNTLLIHLTIFICLILYSEHIKHELTTKTPIFQEPKRFQLHLLQQSLTDSDNLLAFCNLTLAELILDFPVQEHQQGSDSFNLTVIRLSLLVNLIAQFQVLKGIYEQ